MRWLKILNGFRGVGLLVDWRLRLAFTMNGVGIRENVWGGSGFSGFFFILGGVRKDLCRGRTAAVQGSVGVVFDCLGYGYVEGCAETGWSRFLVLFWHSSAVFLCCFFTAVLVFSSCVSAVFFAVAVSAVLLTFFSLFVLFTYPLSTSCARCDSIIYADSIYFFWKYYK